MSSDGSRQAQVNAHQSFPLDAKDGSPWALLYPSLDLLQAGDLNQPAHVLRGHFIRDKPSGQTLPFVSITAVYGHTILSLVICVYVQLCEHVREEVKKIVSNEQRQNKFFFARSRGTYQLVLALLQLFNHLLD